MAFPQVSSPWGKTQSVAPCSLEDVMSEQLAHQLQDKREKHNSLKKMDDPYMQKVEAIVAAEPSEEDMAAIVSAAMEEVDGKDVTRDDEMIARMMQLQYDKEHNLMLDKEARKFNGTNKVTVSFENYKTQHEHYEEEEDDDYDDDDLPVKTKWEEKKPSIGIKGYAGSGKNITTKHDKVICGRKNAERLMEFPPEFESGDGEGMDMQLPNKVYNKLKRHSMTESKRRTRDGEKKEHSTAEKALDRKTRILMYKMVNTRLLESIGGCFAEGKESVVFEGIGGSTTDGEKMPDKVAIKVFKTTLVEFRTREKYVHGDHRFAKDDYRKQNPRKIIKKWAMREVANLYRMRKFDMPCPSVLTLKKNVLVMSFIGGDKPAPKLQDGRLSVPDEQDAYEQTVEIMKTLHRKCSLVHADLSAYNLLWHDGKVYVIDVSQSVDLTHTQAFNFLYRDCTNVSTHFQKRGVYDVLSPEELFNDITGLNIQGEGADFSAQVQRYDKERKESNMVLEQGYARFPFDYFFDKSQQERQSSSATSSTSPPSKKSLPSSVQRILDHYDDSSSEEEEEGVEDNEG